MSEVMLLQARMMAELRVRPQTPSKLFTALGCDDRSGREALALLLDLDLISADTDWTLRLQRPGDGSHIVDGQFQSDKYPTCPAGKVPLSINDPSAQDLLWIYAQRRRVVDANFSGDLEYALIRAGFVGR